MKLTILRAKQLVREKKINRISENHWEVVSGDNTYEVSCIIKKGSREMGCTCDNSSKNTGTGICVHKISVLIFEAEKEYRQKIDEMIKDYNFMIESKITIPPERIKDDLIKLRYIK